MNVQALYIQSKRSSSRVTQSTQRLRVRRRWRRRPRRTEGRARDTMPHVRKRHWWRHRPMGGTELRAQDAMPHRSRGCSRKRLRKGSRPSRRIEVLRLRSGWCSRPTRQTRVLLQGRQPSSTREGIPRARGGAHQRVGMGRSPYTRSSSRRPGQAR